MESVPLHFNLPADPTRRQSVVGALHLDTVVEMDCPLAVLVVAKRFDRQGLQEGLFLGEHGCDLAFGGAVDAGVGPALFPVIEVGLGLFQALEALPLERSFLRVSDAGFDFTFAIRVSDSARHSHHAVVRQHVAVERIDRRIVDVGCEDALAQVVEHHHTRGAA
jgi:hypothetical protein